MVSGEGGGGRLGFGDELRESSGMVDWSEGEKGKNQKIPTASRIIIT